MNYLQRTYLSLLLLLAPPLPLSRMLSFYSYVLTAMMKCFLLLLLCNLHGSSPLGLPPSFSSSFRCSCSASSSSSAPSSSSFANRRNLINLGASTSSSSEDDDKSIQVLNDDDDSPQDDDDSQRRQLDQNTKYITTLLSNLEQTLDKYIITGSMSTRRRAYNILQQVKRLSMDTSLYDRAERMVKRSGMSLEVPPPVEEVEHVPATDQQRMNQTTTVGFGNANNNNNDRRYKNLYTPDKSDDTISDDASSSSSCGGYVPIQTGRSNYSPTTVADEQTSNRINLAEERLKWEQQQQERNSLEKHYNTVTDGIKKNINDSDKEKTTAGARSALSARMQNSKGGDPFVSSMVEGDLGGSRDVDDLVEFAQDKKELQSAMSSSSSSSGDFGAVKASELIARAGAGSAFEGETLGVGGLDDVLSEIQRRVWIPLAAPPTLLSELGIQPVRGLLLYGSPGCGKTLLARKLGSILSPARPITIVSGPEILDKFVGSSEKNLREIFDNPPDLYFNYKKNYGDELANTALHVIVLDEFDAIARSRGGAGGGGDQGDAGVARDSVVNQLLSKMDGANPLGVPTLLIGLTNKPSLIDPALMRPGRFEVQINVPKPKTVEQRVAILKVHMSNMIKSGRVLVRDCPEGTPAFKHLQAKGSEGVPSFDELLDLIAVETDGMSGASLAGVSRAAASRALERAVTDFAGKVTQDSMGLNDIDSSGQNSIADCLVTFEDFEKAVEDVFESAKGSDYVEPPSKTRKAKKSKEADITPVSKTPFNTGNFMSLKKLLPEKKITKDSWRQSRLPPAP